MHRIPERFLRYIWEHQAFSSRRLVTSDGARVVVRFPGVLNADGGPDFTGASVRIGGVLYRGDVELHVRIRSWRSHGHCTDPHYNRVILHVVFFPGGAWPPPETASGRTVPLLVLSPFVDPLLYSRWVIESGRKPLPSLRCPEGKSNLPSVIPGETVRALGRRRIEHRVRALGRRYSQILGEGKEDPPIDGDDLRSFAWAQILYESLLEGMGYSGNRSPFLALARSVPLVLLRSCGLRDPRTMQALLFGAAGLLPPLSTLRSSECRAYVRVLRRKWSLLRPSSVLPLHEGDWMFFRLRPVNFPTARLAAFCFLLPSLFASRPVERILAALRSPGGTPRSRRRAIASMIRISPDGFWRRHCSFRTGHRGEGIALGSARVQELIVNGIIPLALLHARLSADRLLRRESLGLLDALPAAVENRVTRIVKAALGAASTGLRHPVEQQGLLHLYRIYCSRLRCRCCPLRAGVRMSRRCSPERTSRCRRQ